jgi:hypothetical protein
MAKINAKTTSGGGIETVGDASGVLELQSDGTTRQYIDASGNVGIGTSSPSVKLDVTTSDAATAANFTNTNAAYAGDVYIKYAPSGVTASELLFSTRSTALTWIQSSYGALTFRTGTLGSASERMRIDSSGNLLVGTTDTGALSRGIVVRGGISNSYLSVGHVAGTGSGNWYANFDFSGTNIGAIAQNGTTAVSYNTTSDYRLKENIAPMIGALDTVAALKPVTYKWKSDGSDGQGFIAHELQEVVPDCVTGEKDAVDAEGNPVYQGIDTSFLVATLTAAIQEQQAIITDLKARIEVLEGASA